MVQAVGGLTKHTVVVCVSKRERSALFQTILDKAGFNTVIALNLYDALKLISQEMPHLVVADSQLTDGTAALLYDRVHQDESLSRIPMMVNILKKTREVLEPLAKRKFAGFFVGQLEPKTFIGKIKQVMEQNSVVSPYYYHWDQLDFAPDLTICVDAHVIGLKGDQLVVESPIEVDPAASLLCVPQKAGFGPALLRMASNLREKTEIYNVFPLSRIGGSGRKWISDLGQMDAEDKVKANHCILFFDPNEARFEQFKGILQGYNIESVYAKNLRTAAAMLKSSPDTYGGVYLHELMNDGSGIAFKEVYQKIDDKLKPPLLVGTTSQNVRSTPMMRYICRPFGLGIFVEGLLACFNRANDITNEKDAAQSKGGSIAVSYQSPAKLVGLDEVGGIIQLRYPIVKDSRLVIKHEALNEIWDGNTQIRVTDTQPVPGEADVYQARFQAIAALGSKAKYWQKLGKAIQPYLKELKSA